MSCACPVCGNELHIRELFKDEIRICEGLQQIIEDTAEGIKYLERVRDDKCQYPRHVRWDAASELKGVQSIYDRLVSLLNTKMVDEG